MTIKNKFSHKPQNKEKARIIVTIEIKTFSKITKKENEKKICDFQTKHLFYIHKMNLCYIKHRTTDYTGISSNIKLYTQFPYTFPTYISKY